MSEITNNPSVEGLQGLLITKAEKLTEELAKGNIGAALHTRSILFPVKWKMMEALITQLYPV